MAIATVGTATSGPTRGPSATQPPAPFSGDGFTTPVPPLGTAWTALRWIRLAPDDPLSLVTTAERWSGGYVAVGWDPTAGRSTPVWTSSDGERWDAVTFGTATTFWPGTWIVGLGATRDGRVVALGQAATDCGGTCAMRFTGPVVAWTSSDGRRWSPHAIPLGWLDSATGSAPLLAAGPAGLLAASSGLAPHLARSTDGVDWMLVPATALPATFALNVLAATADGYVALGRLERGTGPNAAGDAAVASSIDGVHWTKPLVLPEPRSASGRSTGVALMVASGGIVAVARVVAAPGGTAWWTSGDGGRWSPDSAFTPLGRTDCVAAGCGLGPGGDLLADGTRVVAVRFGPGASAWVSDDAAAWSLVPMTGDLPDVTARAVALLPSGVLATAGGSAWLGVPSTR